MKKFVSFFTNNSILVNFITIFVLVVGTMSIYSIQKELRPPISIDKVTIRTSYIGASPAEIEKLITIPIEEELKAIYGIDRVESLSYTGMSYLIVDVDPDVKDKSSVIDDIFRAVNSIKDLPDDAEDPVAREIKAQRFPIYGIALYGNVDLFTLRKWAKLLQNELEDIKGVSDANITGVRDPTIDITVDPKEMQLKSVSVFEIMNTLKTWNRSAPAGYININSKEIPVRIDENLNEIENISNLIVRINDMGNAVKIRDVAQVKWGFKNNRKLNRYNSKQNVQITVSKKENADTIKTIKVIKKTIRDFEKRLPKEIKTLEYRDDSIRISKKLNSVNQNAMLGLILVVVLLLLMLNWRIALVTALGLPVAFFGSIWAIESLGYSLNSLTIIGIILVVGMLVDDGIVVAENIFYHYEKGKDRNRAAIDGTTEIIIPVIGTVLTTIVAFLPLVYVSGIAGKFMSIIPIGVITCLTFSLLECILILPNHASDFMSHRKSKLSIKLNEALAGVYKPVIAFVIKRRWIITPIILIAIIGTSFYFIATFKMKMFPTRGITRFSFNIEGPANTRLEETDLLVKKIETKVNKYIGKYITGYRSRVGNLDGRRGLAYIGPNCAGFRVYLLDEEDLPAHPRKIAKEIREVVTPLIPEDWTVSFEIGRHGPPMGKPLEIEVSHDNFDLVVEVSSIIKKKLKTVKGATDVTDDILRGYKEFVLNINKEKASMLGIDPSTVQKTTMSSFEGIAATKVRKLDDEYDVMVMYPKSYREKKKNLLNLMIKTKYGSYVRLGKIATLKDVNTIGSVKHVNNKRTVVVMASLEGRKITAYEINKKMEEFVNAEVRDKYPDVKINFGGEEEKRKALLDELLKLFLIALLAIYMILSLVFHSAIYPFFVLLIIPFGFVGALLALKLYGEVVSFPGLISLVGLTGVVVNDAIILVTFIRNRFKETKDIINSIIEGATRRLRPIVLTTFTTVVALIPAIYELGGQDANMRPMAIVIAWGLLMATTMTMIFIPGFMGCLYDLLGYAKNGLKNGKNS